MCFFYAVACLFEGQTLSVFGDSKAIVIFRRSYSLFCQLPFLRRETEAPPRKISHTGLDDVPAVMLG